MRASILLALGLLACVPKAAPVEAPVAVSIPPLPKAEPAPPTGPIYIPKWTITRLWYLDTQEIVVDPTQIVYLRNEEKVTVTSKRGGLLLLECDKGVEAILFCKTANTFQFTCNQITLKLDCEKRKFTNGIEEESEEIQKESETQ